MPGAGPPAVQLHCLQTLYSCTLSRCTAALDRALYSCTRQGSAVQLHCCTLHHRQSPSSRRVSRCLASSPAQPSPAQPGYCLQCGQAGVVWCRVPCLERPSLHSPDDDITPIYLYLSTHHPLSPSPILSSLVTNSPLPLHLDSSIHYTYYTYTQPLSCLLSTLFT